MPEDGFFNHRWEWMGMDADGRTMEALDECRPGEEDGRGGGIFWEMGGGVQPGASLDVRA
ncbi:hypothetical protein CMV30_09315 [Nibricoccus aquaticus]|uniref:Uncharacterized protein n=1 Tax=Nibricoccus aquaticus TaxID=2576891 RepID=A0A290Q791_9BACT|nr:hypothetical protein CMV30_09315 [Nibricoccus aquaticus]